MQQDGTLLAQRSCTVYLHTTMGTITQYNYNYYYYKLTLC